MTKTVTHTHVLHKDAGGANSNNTLHYFGLFSGGLSFREKKENVVGEGNVWLKIPALSGLSGSGGGD